MGTVLPDTRTQSSSTVAVCQDVGLRTQLPIMKHCPTSGQHSVGCGCSQSSHPRAKLTDCRSTTCAQHSAGPLQGAQRHLREPFAQWWRTELSQPATALPQPATVWCRCFPAPGLLLDTRAMLRPSTAPALEATRCTLTLRSPGRGFWTRSTRKREKRGTGKRSENVPVSTRW